MFNYIFHCHSTTTCSTSTAIRGGPIIRTGRDDQSESDERRTAAAKYHLVPQRRDHRRGRATQFRVHHRQRIHPEDPGREAAGPRRVQHQGDQQARRGRRLFSGHRHR